MKTKSGENKKKLVLKKISIAQLDDDKIKEIKAGGECSDPMFTCEEYCCPTYTCICK
jgi:hypothetical protein